MNHIYIFYNLSIRKNYIISSVKNNYKYNLYHFRILEFYWMYLCNSWSDSLQYTYAIEFNRCKSSYIFAAAAFLNTPEVFRSYCNALNSSSSFLLPLFPFLPLAGEVLPFVPPLLNLNLLRSLSCKILSVHSWYWV